METTTESTASLPPPPLNFIKPAEVQNIQIVRRITGDTVRVPTFDFQYIRYPENTNKEKTLLANDLRLEYAKFLFYEKLGVSVPHARLFDEDGKAGLEIHLPRGLQKISLNDSRDVARLTPTQLAQINEIYLASRIIGNDHFICSLAIDPSGRVMITSAVPRDQEDGLMAGRENRASAIFTNSDSLRSYLKLYPFLPKELQFKDYTALGERLKTATPQFLADILIKSGMNADAIRHILQPLLSERKWFTESIRLANTDWNQEAMADSSGFNEIDNLFTGSINNRSFAKLANNESNIPQMIANAREAIDAIGKPADPLALKVSKPPMSYQQMDSQLMIDEMDNPESITTTAQKVAGAEEALQQVKKSKNRLIYSLQKYPDLELKVVDKIDMLKIRFREWLDVSYNRLVSNVQELAYLRGHSLNKRGSGLDTYVSPTLNQLTTITDALNALRVDEVIGVKEMGAVDGLMLERFFFKEVCRDRSSALVAHITKPSLMQDSIRRGTLCSGLRQRELGLIPNINSGGGDEILPQLCFSVNSAEPYTYGGLDDPRTLTANATVLGRQNGRVPFIDHRSKGYNVTIHPELSVAFVAPYKTVVQKGQFLEHVVDTESPELHVFHPEYREEASGQKGMEMGVEDLYIVIPESQKAYWTSFVAKLKEEGGAGKTQEWATEHIRTYPSYLDLDLYLRYFIEKNEFGISNDHQALGVMVSDGKKVTPHHQKMPDYQQQRYIWKETQKMN